MAAHFTVTINSVRKRTKGKFKGRNTANIELNAYENWKGSVDLVYTCENDDPTKADPSVSPTSDDDEYVNEDLSPVTVMPAVAIDAPSGTGFQFTVEAFGFDGSYDIDTMHGSIP